MSENLDTRLSSGCSPVLSCEAAQRYEAELLDAEEAEWVAMQRVGACLADALRRDYSMTSLRPAGLSVLLLVGKGHNGADALLAAKRLWEEGNFLSSITLVLATPRSELRANTERALQLLERSAGDGLLLQVQGRRATKLIETSAFDLCLDGFLGMQLQGTLRPQLRATVRAVNASERIGFRVAVDIPTGLSAEGDADAFEADVTYATGIVKLPVVGDSKKVGVLRYLDIGFFPQGSHAKYSVLGDRILDPLRLLRRARSDKRSNGHLLIVAGSRCMPGAARMCAEAALRAGVGLLTVLAPQSVCAALAPQLPEAMLKALPETESGELAAAGWQEILGFQDRATALVAGPGLGRSEETSQLLREVGARWEKPVLLDADALRPEIVEAFTQATRVLTPHAGERKRLGLADGEAPDGAVVVAKGPSTRVLFDGYEWVSPVGNAVLARGGSGDILAGMLGARLAVCEDAVALAACQAVYWHGRAADLLAQERGQIAVRTTELMDFLGAALQIAAPWNPS